MANLNDLLKKIDRLVGNLGRHTTNTDRSFNKFSRDFRLHQRGFGSNIISALMGGRKRKRLSDRFAAGAGYAEYLGLSGTSKTLSTASLALRASQGNVGATFALIKQGLDTVRNAAKTFRQETQLLGQSLGKVFTSKTVGGSISAAGQAMSHAGTAMPFVPKPARDLIQNESKWIEKSGSVLNKLEIVSNKMDTWASEMSFTNMRRFSDYSAPMARATIEQEMRDIWYKKQRGDARADTTAYEAEQASTLRNRMAPFLDATSKTFSFLNATRDSAISNMMGENTGLPWWGNALAFAANPVAYTAWAAQRTALGAGGFLAQQVSPASQSSPSVDVQPVQLDPIQPDGDNWFEAYGRPQRFNQ